MQNTQTNNTGKKRPAIVRPLHQTSFDRRVIGLVTRSNRTYRIVPGHAKGAPKKQPRNRSIYAPARPFDALPADCALCLEWADANIIYARMGHRVLFRLTDQRVHKALSVASVALGAHYLDLTVTSISAFFSAQNFAIIVANCCTDFVITRVLIQIAVDWIEIDADRLKELEVIAHEHV